MNSRQYRRWRKRRHAAWIEANRKRTHPDTEAEHLIDFASMWASFGGAPEAEVLVHFGMTTPQFIERLWQVIPESSCTRDEISALTSAYPPPELVNRQVQAADCLTDPQNLRHASQEHITAENNVEQQ
ncbi:hypothetical protein [Rhodococcus koreensis]